MSDDTAEARAHIETGITRKHSSSFLSSMLDIELYYKIDGKRVSPKEFGDSLEDKMRKMVAQQIVEQLEGIECPEHGESPTVIVEEMKGEEMNFRFEACCEKPVVEAQEKLGAERTE